MMIIIYSMIAIGFVQAATHGMDHGSMPCCNGGSDSPEMDLSLPAVLGMVDMIAADVAVDEPLASHTDHDNGVCADQLSCASCAAGGCGSFIPISSAQTIAAADQHMGKTRVSVFCSFYPLTETKPPRPFPRSA